MRLKTHVHTFQLVGARVSFMNVLGRTPRPHTLHLASRLRLLNVHTRHTHSAASLLGGLCERRFGLGERRFGLGERRFGVWAWARRFWDALLMRGMCTLSSPLFPMLVFGFTGWHV